MSERDPHDELKALFAEADAALNEDASGFTWSVMARVRRRAFVRRAVLATASVFGAVLAALQVPDVIGVLNGVVGISGDGPLSVDMGQLTTAITGVDPRIIAAACLGAAALIVTLTAETD